MSKKFLSPEELYQMGQRAELGSLTTLMFQKGIYAFLQHFTMLSMKAMESTGPTMPIFKPLKI